MPEMGAARGHSGQDADAGWRMQNAGWKMQGAGCRTEDAGCRMQSAGSGIRDAGCGLGTERPPRPGSTVDTTGFRLAELFRRDLDIVPCPVPWGARCPVPCALGCPVPVPWDARG